ncbi:hypothetical protein L7F22_055685, partial [Adiantum nelumboides]|nr:hypothetical protein [Adiantum nelumboides]
MLPAGIKNVWEESGPWSREQLVPAPLSHRDRETERRPRPRRAAQAQRERERERERERGSHPLRSASRHPRLCTYILPELRGLLAHVLLAFAPYGAPLQTPPVLGQPARPRPGARPHPLAAPPSSCGLRLFAAPTAAPLHPSAMSSNLSRCFSLPALSMGAHAKEAFLSPQQQ